LKLKQLKIRAKLIIIFCCFTAVIALQGYVGIFHINDMSRLFDGMYQDNLLPLNELRNIESEINNIRINTYRYLGSADPEKMTKSEQMLQANQSAIEKKINIGGDKYQRLNQLFQQSSRITQEIIALHYNFNTREAYQLMNGRGQKIYDDLISLVNHFTQEKTQIAKSNLHAGHLINRSIVYVMLGVIILSLLLTIVIGFVFSKNLTQPIDKISKSFRELGHGKLSNQLDQETLERNDEFGVMALSYEKTRKKLHELIDSLKTTNEDLVQATVAAESANRAKSDFLANMSHEIRTPLNAVLGFTEILKGKLKDVHHLHYLESIHYSAKSLLNLINDILDLSKVEAGKLELEYAGISAHDLFNEIKIIFAHKIKEKGIQLIIEISPDLPKILYLDESRLRQVLINLVGNAIKFTRQGHVKILVNVVVEAEVEVVKNRSAKDKYISLIIAVEDTGIGIPEDEYHSVFENFTQMTGQKNSEFSGTGLGLTISKRLVEMMHGSIAVRSKVGHGTTFTVTLQHIEIVSSPSLTEELEQITDLSQILFHPNKILIVDDIELNREVIKGFLENYPLQLFEAESGLESIQMAKQYLPDLILMDIKMTDMTGYEASKNIREVEGLKQSPIIAVTASAMKSDEERMRSDFEGYLKKPLMKSELIFQLMKYLPHDIHAVQIEKNIETQYLDWSETQKSAYTDLLSTIKMQQDHCESVFKQQAFDKIKNFSLEMEKLGEKYQYSALIHWAEILHLAVEDFDIDKIKELSASFNLLVSELEEKLLV